ncbi:MAG TPA: biosynthetic peptidoglycan transglycosylase [Pseudomonadota bacterium]|nr:biosynthetic peptidoglycan transglycosylase [Pseudomonadota bacterium]
MRPGIWLGGLGLLAFLTGLSLPLFASYAVRQFVLPKVEERLGARISVRDIVVRPHYVRLTGVGVRSQKGASVDPVGVSEVRVEYVPWSLLLGRVEVTRLSAYRPLLQIIRGGDDDNISALLARLRKKDGKDASPSGGSGRLKGPEQVVVSDGEIDIRDDLGVVHVRSFAAQLAKQGDCQVTFSDVTVDPTSGAGAKAEKVQLVWKSPSRFVPEGLPEVRIDHGSVAPWQRLSLTGVSGTIKADPQDGRKAVIALAGGYGGVDHQLWQADGWVLPEGSDWKAGGVQGELHLRAQRFRLSQLEPILKDTPVIDADQTEVDASMDLRFEKSVLSAAGTFQMAHLSLFAPRLVAEPVRDLTFDARAKGQVDLKARKLKLDELKVRWAGVEVQLDGEAEAQPQKLRPSVLQASAAQAAGSSANGAPTGVSPAGSSWREKWRTVSLHFAVPPIQCQSLLQALPKPVVPRIRDFQLDGTFSTDVRVFVDFAKLLKLPPPSDPDSLDEENPALVAAPVAMVAKKPVVVPPKGRPGQPVVPNGNGSGTDTKDQPVQISGQVGIGGCKVLKAPSELDVSRLLASFTHTVQVEQGRELSFVIGPENPDFVPFEQLSPFLVNSIMTTEDHGFLRHRGFIVPEFRSALQSNLERGYFRLGASSITMQMVKNVLLSREKTLSRKLQEMFLTWYVENYLTEDQDMVKAFQKGWTVQQYLAKVAKDHPLPPGSAPAKDPKLLSPSQLAAEQSFQAIREATPIKRRILEIYFNAIEFGPYIYGIGRAARHYFGKEAKDLNPREAAFFSSILPNPKRRYIQYCKGAADDGWEKYVERIVRRVHSRGRMTDEDLQAALASRLVFDRREALSEKECQLLVQYFSELPPPGAPPPPPPPPGSPQKVIPPLPPWIEMHHGKLRYVAPKDPPEGSDPGANPSNHSTAKPAVLF